MGVVKIPSHPAFLLPPPTPPTKLPRIKMRVGRELHLEGSKAIFKDALESVAPRRRPSVPSDSFMWPGPGTFRRTISRPCANCFQFISSNFSCSRAGSEFLLLTLGEKQRPGFTPAAKETFHTLPGFL